MEGNGGRCKKSQLLDKINNILCFVDVIVVDEDFSIFPSVNLFFFFACSFFSNAHYELKSLTEGFCTHLPSPDKMLSWGLIGSNMHPNLSISSAFAFSNPLCAGGSSV